MNISYKWLREYLDTDLGAEALAEALTSIGLETGSVERVESIRGGLAGIVIGKVLTCEIHPDSDHLHITTVDLGDPQNPVQIVCGAPNVAAGQTVVVATVGTTLYSPDGESFKIKRSKIRGVESLGMICAEDEIGVGNSHDGIIVLPAEADALIGHPASEYYKIDDDFIIEVDLTPNRIDAASHYGVARDLAAYLSCHADAVKAHRPSVDGFAVDEPQGRAVSVEVADTAGCVRYCGLTIEGVTVGDSPEWLRDKLNAIGMHPVNNVVDITNFILHAFGQPLHAFDADTLAADKVVVRRATEGAKFTTLDGVERTLDAADLMICDAEQARCMAGVFGGLDSGVTDATTRVFLESACFNATSVRRTARRHGISTDSSFRFERGVDPNGCMYALKLAAMLIKETAGGKICGQPVDIYPVAVNPAHVEMEFSDFARLIGREIPADTVRTILESLECHVTDNDGHLGIDVPTYRVDVTRPCDIIEDVLRIYGYNNIAMSDELHACLSFKTAVDAADDFRRLLAEQLCGAGYSEILNNSLTARAYYTDNATYPAEGCVELLNPLSQELNVMRRTLLYGGLETLAHNINRRAADLALYEFGNVYSAKAGTEPTAEQPLAPYTEGARLALWLTGNARTGNWLRPTEEATFYDLKATVEAILRRAGIAAVFNQTEADGDIFDAAMEITTTKGATPLGTIGIVSRKTLRMADIKAAVFFAELDWDAVARLAQRHRTVFSPLPRTQAVRRDLSLLLDAGTDMAQIQTAVRRCDSKLIHSVSLFDVYEGKNLPAGKKSYAISIEIQDDEKTLQDKHIDKIMSKVTETLRRTFGAELR
ncbi:phenylalanine--tRNA ligase subunit beta [Muribaculum intestinale]|uniref:phenylalanine--tRNA ligase subunit beta n=1 Tax=Muribaculum intestinale TaxID=1796646 RepID=UPI0025B5D348|nr:phenylalanine--tRNA ligase subunit beta [Muribaculum intestinale]